jgi:hypothetical protein
MLSNEMAMRILNGRSFSFSVGEHDMVLKQERPVIRVISIFAAFLLLSVKLGAHPQGTLPPLGRINCGNILVSHQVLTGFPDMDFSQWPLMVIISNNPPGTEWRISWMIDTTVGYLYPDGTGIYVVDDFRIHDGHSQMYHTANAWLEHRQSDLQPWVYDGYVYRSAVCAQ